MDVILGERIYGLHERFQLLSGTYNPRNLNLHFDNPPRADAALFEGLLAIGSETWLVASHCLNVYRRLPEESVDLFMFFYDLFLLIAAAARRINREGDQVSVSFEVIGRVVELLVHTAQYSVRVGGDTYLRNHEVLGNIVLAFYDQELLRRARRRARAIGTAEVERFVEKTIACVEEVRAQRAEQTEPSVSEGGGTSEIAPSDAPHEPPNA